MADKERPIQLDPSIALPLADEQLVEAIKIEPAKPGSLGHREIKLINVLWVLGAASNHPKAEKLRDRIGNRRALVKHELKPSAQNA